MQIEKFCLCYNPGSLTISSPLAITEGLFYLKRRNFRNYVVLKYRNYIAAKNSVGWSRPIIKILEYYRN